MLTYISKFLSGGLDPFWPHLTLLSLAVLASIAVGAGIIFERPKYSIGTHRVAFWLVVVGIAIEAICTIFLFVFDEGISDAQQSKIIALEVQIAPRRISPEACVAIASSLASLSGNVKVESYAADLEGGILAWQVANCLEASKTLTIAKAFASIMPMGGFGVGVFVTGPDEKLVAAIRAGLSDSAKIFVGEGSGLSAGNMNMSPQNEPPMAATVLVAIRPLPEMIPK
jgi:hypothetical protein